MKTKEEMNALRNEVEALNRKLAELTPDELTQVVGGFNAVQMGWVDADGHRYFYHPNGTKVTGWLLDDGKWYFFNALGEMQTGWIQDGGKWYYLNPNGELDGQR